MVERVTATVEALEFIDYLKRNTFALMFYQSGLLRQQRPQLPVARRNHHFRETTSFLEIGGCPFTSASRTTSSISTPR